MVEKRRELSQDSQLQFACVCPRYWNRSTRVYCCTIALAQNVNIGALMLNFKALPWNIVYLVGPAPIDHYYHNYATLIHLSSDYEQSTRKTRTNTRTPRRRADWTSGGGGHAQPGGAPQPQKTMHHRHPPPPPPPPRWSSYGGVLLGCMVLAGVLTLAIDYGSLLRLDLPRHADLTLAPVPTSFSAPWPSLLLLLEQLPDETIPPNNAETVAGLTIQENEDQESSHRDILLTNRPVGLVEDDGDFVSLPKPPSSPPRLILFSYYKLAFPRILPGYSMLWLRSCQAIASFADCSLTLILDSNDTRTIQDLLPCKQQEFAHYASMIRNISLSEMVMKMAALGSKQKFTQRNSHRKANDLKPLFAYFHQDLILEKKYTHWGWTDIDGVLGMKIGQYLQNDHLIQTFLCCTCVAMPNLYVSHDKEYRSTKASNPPTSTCFSFWAKIQGWAVDHFACRPGDHVRV